MNLPAIGDLIRTHSHIAFAVFVVGLAAVGFLEIRAFPRKPGAYWTLSFALLPAAFALFRSTSLGTLGSLLGAVVLLVGTVVLVRYYNRSRTIDGRPR